VGGHLRVQAGHARLRPVAPDRRHDLRSAAAVGNGPSAIAGGIRRNDSSTAVPPQGQSRLKESHLVQSRLLSKGRQRAEAPAREHRCA
jgi:hypothetical protein